MSFVDVVGGGSGLGASGVGVGVEAGVVTSLSLPSPSDVEDVVASASDMVAPSLRFLVVDEDMAPIDHDSSSFLGIMVHLMKDVFMWSEGKARVIWVSAWVQRRR